MSAFGELIEQIIELRREVATIKRDLASSTRVGTVSDVDPEKGYRLAFGEDDEGNPKKSPWLPHPDSGGEFKTWRPLSVGQIAMLISPPGDPRKAMMVRDGGFSGENPAPSQALDEYVIGEIGAAKIVMKEDRIVFAVGAATVTITEADIVAALGRSVLKIADKDIDVKARRHYIRGKVAAGLNYSGNAKEFPVQVETVAGAATNLFSKINGEAIPDDD